ncbi:MAG: hypothetical protein AAB432_02610 [Patescibacteria group bacterium]
MKNIIKNKLSFWSQSGRAYQRAGVTMIEMLVAISVFIIVLVLIIGVFIQGLRIERYVTALTEVQSNASLALEQIAREIRGGYNFDPPVNNGGICQGDLGDTLSFKRIKANTETSVSISWNEAANSIERSETKNNEPPIITLLNASNISVNRLCFRLNPPADNPRTNPWRVTLFMTFGSTDKAIAEKVINIQTTVSARVLPKEAQ